MMNTLLPMLGTGAVTSSLNSTNTYGTNPDGSFDPLGYTGALAGATLGGLGGYYGGKYLQPKLPGKLSALTKTTKGAKNAKGAAKAVGSLNKGKGKLLKSLINNPNTLKYGGAALGAMLGAKMLGNSFSAQGHQENALEMQSLAQRDAEDQQRNLMALTQGSNIRF